jgi:2-keto-4-pentenoate hydratase
LFPDVRPDDGTGGLIFGYLTSNTAMKARASFRPGTTVQLCAEVELAVVIGRDVQPDTDLEMAAEAVVGLAVALEIVDVDQSISMDQAVAGNVFHRAATIGSMSSPASCQSVTAALLVDGTVRASEMVAVNPARTVQQMARLLDAFDHRLEAGNTIIGGSLIHLPVQSGQEVSAVIAGLGHIALRLIS